ncbi:MAG: transposase, partial [Acidobacteriota bacterium]
QRPSHMLAWPHSGFHVHDGVWVAADNREFAVRLARYCARNPVALSRLEYQSDDATVTYHSDKPTGPTAGSETLDVWEFLASGRRCRLRCRLMPSESDFNYYSKEHVVRKFVHFVGFHGQDAVIGCHIRPLSRRAP